MCDPMKSVLLRSESWSIKAIAQALRLHPETVSQHLKEWRGEQKLTPMNGGLQGKLTQEQTFELDAHLQEMSYTNVLGIGAYIKEKFSVDYTISGLTKWLHAHDFRCKHMKPVPAKLNPEEQQKLIEKYRN